MDVTRSNFKAVLPDIEKAIDNADFLCMDGEFTGLRTGRDINAFSTPAEYYHILFTESTPFLLVQFGLCAYRYDKISKSFKQCAFNFYIFPRLAGRSLNERIFSCQSSSIDFLATQKFDFNKLFYEGISYTTAAEEVKMREQLEEKQAQANTKRFSTGNTDPKALIVIPEVDKVQIEELCEKVKKFLDEGTADSIAFDNLNSFIRRLLFQELELRFQNTVHIASNRVNDKKSIMVISRVSDQSDLMQKNEETQRLEWEELENCVGFSRIARKISESRKLVIGHCLLLDVIHVLGHFFSPLPEDYKEFKEFATCVFPRILDTMYMTSLPPFKDKINGVSLSSLFTAASEAPFQMPLIESETDNNLVGYEKNDSKYHEAGYDAFVTGQCFLSMCEYLARSQNIPVEEIDFASDTQLLKPFLNKIYLFKTSFQDSPYINLKGNDANPPRDHVFHMEFLKEWKKPDIINLFYQYGGVNVAYINETSAYVGLRRREQTSLVQRALMVDNHNYKLTPYRKYKAMMSRKNEPAENNISATERYNQLHWVADKRSPVTDESSIVTSPLDPIAKKRKSPEDISLRDATDMALPELVPRDSALGIAAMSLMPETPKKASKDMEVDDDEVAAKKRRMASRNQPAVGRGKHQRPPATEPRSKTNTPKRNEKKKARVFPENDDWA